MKKLNKKIIKAIETLGWVVREYKEEYELETCSPAGENLIETISKKEDFLTQFWNLYHNFDEDEHIEMWVNVRHHVSGVPSIRTLVQDSESITEMYKELALTVEKSMRKGA